MWGAMHFRSPQNSVNTGTGKTGGGVEGDHWFQGLVCSVRTKAFPEDPH